MIKTLLWIVVVLGVLAMNVVTPAKELQHLQTMQYYRTVHQMGDRRARRFWERNIEMYRKLVRNVPRGQYRASDQGGMSGVGSNIGNAISRVSSKVALGVRKIMYAIVFFSWPRLRPGLLWMGMAVFVGLFAATVDGMMVRGVRRYSLDAEFTSPIVANSGRWMMWTGSLLIIGGLLIPALVDEVIWVETAGWLLCCWGWIVRLSQVPVSL